MDNMEVKRMNSKQRCRAMYLFAVAAAALFLVIFRFVYLFQPREEERQRWRKKRRWKKGAQNNKSKCLLKRMKLEFGTNRSRFTLFFFVRVLISLRWSVWFVDKMDHLNRFSKRKICDNFEIELRCRLSNKSLILGWRPFIILSVSFIHFEISFSRALCFIFSINFETALLEFFLENGHNFRLKTMRNYCFKLGLGLRERFTIKKPSIALWERTRNRTIYIYNMMEKKRVSISIAV